MGRYTTRLIHTLRVYEYVFLMGYIKRERKTPQKTCNSKKVKFRKSFQKVLPKKKNISCVWPSSISLMRFLSNYVGIVSLQTGIGTYPGNSMLRAIHNNGLTLEQTLRKKKNTLFPYLVKMFPSLPLPAFGLSDFN